MFGSGTSAIRTVLVANQTQAKRLHLDHPGHVLAAIDFGGAKSILQDSSACLFGAARVGGGGSGDCLLACLLVLSSDTSLVGALDVSVADVTFKANGSLAGANTESS
jgi:hypothetical protein